MVTEVETEEEIEEEIEEERGSGPGAEEEGVGVRTQARVGGALLRMSEVAAVALDLDTVSS